MGKKKDEEEEVVPQEPSNLNELMSVIKPFSSGQYIRDILTAVKDGHVDPIAAMVVIKRFEKVAKKSLEDKDFRKIFAETIDRHFAGNTKEVNLYSSRIVRGATYTAYDFKECGHPVLNQLYEIQAEIEDAIDNIEEELKLLCDKKPIDNTLDLSIPSNSKQIVVEKIPVLKYETTDDIATVQAPKKMQTIGFKFMNV